MPTTSLLPEPSYKAPQPVKPHIMLRTDGTALISVRWRLLRDTNDLHDLETVTLAQNLHKLLDSLKELGYTPKHHPSLYGLPPFGSRVYQEPGPKLGRWFCEVKLPTKEL